MEVNYEYFICFRGDNGLGGAIAANVYDTISTVYKYKCFFSSQANRVRGEDYRLAEVNALSTARGIIFVLTNDFFTNIHDENDEVRFEIKTAFSNPNIKKYVIAHSSFNWNDVDLKTLVSVIGLENTDYFKHIDYVKFTGQRDYKEITERQMAQMLGLDLVTLELTRNINSILMDNLIEQLDNRRRYSGSYNLGKITNKLFPSIESINRTIVNDENQEIKTISLFSLLTNNKHGDFLIIGDGGIGKTVMLLETCDLLLKDGIPAIYLPLHEIQTFNIEEKIFEGNEELKKSFFNSKYSVILLDGFNEVADADKGSILKKIETLSKKPGVQVVMTSRFNPRQFDMTFVGFEILKLEPLSYTQISDYISTCGLDVPKDSKLLDTLSYPLMLTLYTNAIGYRDTHGMHEALIWKDNPSSNGQIIWNFLQTQLQKSVFEMGRQRELLNYIFALEFILPDIGFYMLQKEKFEISREDLIRVITKSLQEYKSKWFENVSSRIFEVSFYFDTDDLIYDGPQVLKILTKELNLLNKSSSRNYTFFHQNFRDCLAAVHLINVIKEERMPEDWYNWIEINVLKLVSELITYDQFNELVDKTRNIDYEEDNLIISNLIEIYHIWNGCDFSKFDFNGLDLSNISLREYNIEGACFDNSKISPITFLQRGHTDTILDIVSAHNGDEFMTASIDGSIMIWDILTASFRGVLTGHQSAIVSLFLLDDSTLLSASKDETIYKWDLKNKTGKIIYKHNCSIEDASFCDRYHLFLDEEKNLIVLDDNFTKLYQFENVASFHYCEEAKMLFIFDLNNKLTIYSDFNEINNYSFDNVVTAMKYIDSKNILLVGDENGRLCYINLQSNNIHEIGSHAKKVNKIIEIDDKFIASASNDAKVIVWDYANCEIHLELNSHYKGVQALSFVKRKNLLLSGSIDNSIKVWNVSDGSLIKTIEGYTNWINCVTKSKTSSTIVSASGDKSLRVWNYDSYSWSKTYKEHSDWVYTCDLDESGTICVSGGCDGAVIVRDLTKSSVIMSKNIHNGDVKTVSISNDGRIVASCGSDGYLHIVEVGTGNVIVSHNFGTKLYRVALSPDGKKVIVGSSDCSLSLFDIEKQEILWKVMDVIEGGIRGIDVTSDFSKVICGGNESRVKEFEVSTGNLLKVYNFSCDTRTINYNDDESLIAVGDLYGQIEIVTSENKVVFSSNVHKGEIRSIKFIGNDVIMSGGSDSYILFTNINNKKAKIIKPVFILNIEGCSFKNIKVTDQSLYNIIKENGGLI